MKQLFWLMLVFIPFFGKCQQSPDDRGVQWTKALNWNQVKEEAKKENKFIFVDCYATWCLPCKQMDKDVYTDEKVAELMNEKFISIKLQMDETANDNEKVKEWYSISRSFQNEYKFEGYPSFLFFSPDSKLTHRGLGFKTVNDFINLVNEALTDPITRYNNAITKFKNGQLSFSDMPDLAIQARKKSDKIYVSILECYKQKYVDKLNDTDAFTPENLYILALFSSELLKSNDRYFKFFYEHTNKADSVIGLKKGEKFRVLAADVVVGIIQKEEINDVLYKNGKPITSRKASWKAIKKSIAKKYGSNYIEKAFSDPDVQINFYRSAKNWNNYVKYVNKKIKKFPPTANGRLLGPFSDAWQLNVYVWWLFEGCENKNILKKGLPWIDKSIQIKEAGYNLDTKANLLYRMGRVSDAIAVEEKALLVTQDEKVQIAATLKKMKAGVPTWRLTN